MAESSFSAEARTSSWFSFRGSCFLQSLSFLFNYKTDLHWPGYHPIPIIYLQCLWCVISNISCSILHPTRRPSHPNPSNPLLAIRCDIRLKWHFYILTIVVGFPQLGVFCDSKHEDQIGVRHPAIFHTPPQNSQHTKNSKSLKIPRSDN